MSDITRGTCSKCGWQDLRLLKDGTIGPHDDKRITTTLPFSPRCAGHRLPPKPGSITSAAVEHPTHGICAHCDGRNRLTKDGTVFNHYDKRIPPRPQQGWCRGSGEKPKEAAD